jgi:enoyl-CoA hydratase/carnithine racemase
MANDETKARDEVQIEREGVRATVWLNRPTAHNALSEIVLDGLAAAFRALAREREVRAIVLAARGRAFCAGHDLREMRATPSDRYYRELFERCTQVMMAIRAAPQPVIARVHGIATAAGCQLVAMCDLAVASDAARFAVSGVNLGLFCSTPSVALSRNVGQKQAFEMLVTGEFIDASQALAWGLVNRVVAPQALDAEIEALVRAIAAKAEVAVRMGKDLFYRQRETGLAAAYQLAGQTMACNMMDPAALDGVQAFLEKRAPELPSSRTPPMVTAGLPDGRSL